MTRMVLLLVIMMGFPIAAFAQDGLYFPGSVWATIGRSLAPAEPRNVSGIIHLEQGVAHRGAELYGVGELYGDRQDRDWNNRFIGGVGARLTQTIGSGMVRGGVAYLVDHRRLSDTTYRGGMTIFVETWFGWGRRNLQPANLSPTTLNKGVR